MTTVTPEVTGLRKRLSSLRPRDGTIVPDLRVLHDCPGNIPSEEEDAEILDESILRSSSSGSSSASNESGAAVGGDHHTQKKDVNIHDPLFSTERENDESNKKRLNSSPHVRFRRRHRRTSSSGGDRQYNFDSSSVSSSSSWLGYDLSIIVALVSPIGNLLTGSDHIKNIFLILLLIYYLHQLVEVPWELYRTSVPVHAISDQDSEDSPKHRAHSELRSLEFFYLILTVVSPFVGATLLRYVAAAISGDPKTLSWFSTTLFVLATGIRPWTHLVQRLKDRSRVLNELLEEHVNTSGQQGVERDALEEAAELRVLIGALDTRLAELSAKNQDEWSNMAEHVADVVDGVEQVLRRQREEITRSSKQHEARFAALEAHLTGINSYLLSKEGVEDPAQLGGSYKQDLQNGSWEALGLIQILKMATTMLRVSFARFGLSKPILRPEQSKSFLPRNRSRSSVLEPIPEEESSATQVPHFLADESDHTLVVDPSSEEVKGRELHHITKKLAIWCWDSFVMIVVFFFSPVRFALRLALAIVRFPHVVFQAMS